MGIRPQLPGSNLPNSTCKHPRFLQVLITVWLNASITLPNSFSLSSAGCHRCTRWAAPLLIHWYFCILIWVFKSTHTHTQFSVFQVYFFRAPPPLSFPPDLWSLESSCTLDKLPSYIHSVKALIIYPLASFNTFTPRNTLSKSSGFLILHFLQLICLIFPILVVKSTLNK